MTAVLSHTDAKSLGFGTTRISTYYGQVLSINSVFEESNDVNCAACTLTIDPDGVYLKLRLCVHRPVCLRFKHRCGYWDINCVTYCEEGCLNC